MGLLVDGQWRDQWYDTKSSGGKFIREESRFRDWLGEDGPAAAAAADAYPAEADRYHLYVSLACPWAHRTLIMRALKGLQDIIGVSVVSPVMLEQGWTFNRVEGSSGDPLGNREFLHQVYTQARPDYTGRVTVPLLWDKRNNTIVNNESAEIVRMFNSAFNDLTGNRDDYYPQALRAGIDAWNERIYPAVNNGVYRCGFAASQEAYEEAFEGLFATLDRLEHHHAGPFTDDESIAVSVPRPRGPFGFVISISAYRPGSWAKSLPTNASSSRSCITFYPMRSSLHRMEEKSM